MSESLRDQLTAAFDQHVETPPAETPPAEAPAAEPKVEAPAVETVQAEPDKPGRTAGRARDDKGRLLPGPAVKPEETQASPAAASVAAPVAPKPHPQRPSSWKKDFWGHWEKLPPELAEYINQREGEYAKGVSTYKGEWDRAKPILDTIAQFQPVIQATGFKPEQWINELGTAHRMLSQGTQEQKLGAFLAIAVNNGIDLNRFAERVFVRGQDGNLYLNQQALQARQPQQPAQQPQDVRQVVQGMLAEERANAEIAAMSADKQKYPHFEAVRETMLGLLQGGLAQDLPSAYEKALPHHSDIWNAIQEQKRAAEEKEKREKEAARIAAAKAAAVSPKGATPTSGATAGGKKGLRSTIEDAIDLHVGGGRV